MTGFFSALFKPDQMHDGTRRAALETVAVAKEDLDKSTDKLLETIRDMLNENDRVNRRLPRNAPRQ